MDCWVERNVPVDVTDMKRIVLTMMLLFVSLFCVISCASYRPSIKEDFKISETLTRSQFVNFPVNEQVALFIELPSEMKCRLYRYKIEKELSAQNLSFGEKRWLRKLLRFVTPEFYENDCQAEGFESFKNKFSRKMIEDYGWTEKEFFLYTETIMTSDEYNLSVHAK